MEAQPLTEEQIADLKAEHGKIIAFTNDEIGETFVVRLPHPDETRRFQLQSAQEERREGAIHSLCLACTVWPPREQLEVTLKVYTFAGVTLAGQIMKAAGLAPDSSVQKKVL